MAKYAGELLDVNAQASQDWAVATQGNKVVTLSAEEAAKFDAALEPLTADWLKDVTAKGLPADDFYKKLQAAAATFAQ